MIKRRFEIPIYFGGFFVVVDTDVHKAAERLGMKDSLSERCEAAAARKVPANGIPQYAVFFGAKTPLTALAHESKHVVNLIFADRGVLLDTENDEAECYFLEWVFEKVYSVWLKYHNQG